MHKNCRRFMQRITNMKPPAGTCNCPDGRFFPLFAAKKFFEKRKNPKFPCNTDEHAPAPEADRAKRIDRIPKTNIAAIAVLIHRMLFSFSDKAGQHAEYCPIRYHVSRRALPHPVRFPTHTYYLRGSDSNPLLRQLHGAEHSFLRACIRPRRISLNVKPEPR